MCEKNSPNSFFLNVVQIWWLTQVFYQIFVHEPRIVTSMHNKWVNFVANHKNLVFITNLRNPYLINSFRHADKHGKFF